MTSEYKFFRLNLSGVVDTAKVLKFSDDETAIGHARDFYHPGQVEVWAGKRRIGIVPPMVDRRRPAERRAG